MAIKTYDQAVADGDIFEWSAEGSQVASADRFNQNEEFLANQDVELNNAIGAVANGLNSLSQALQEAQTALSGQITDAKTEANEALQEAVDTLNGSLATIQQSIDDLDAMYATDTDIVEKIRQINEAWLNADNGVQGALTALINARYTKTEVDDLLGAKADKLTTYTKTQVDDKIPSTFDDIGA